MIKDYPSTIKDRLKLLDNVRVVLVSPKFPGNLGMSARSMKNCGVTDMRLVAPRAELNKEAYQLAPSGSDILDTAQIHENLRDAVYDCGLVIGTTRRRGVMRRNILSPEEAAAMVRAAIQMNKVALVFGAEDTGLGNDDLSLCHWIVGMHTGTGFESFNLSHSVSIILYLLNRALIGGEGSAKKLASSHDQENMFADIGRYLLEIGFLHEQDPKRMMVTIRQILNRAGLSDREVKILRGVLRQSRWRIKNPDAPLLPRDTPQQIKRKIMKKRKK